MQNPRQFIAEKLKWILGEMGVSDVELEVSLVQNPDHGDFSTNIAMVCSKKIQQNPRELAERIVAKLKENQDVNEMFDDIQTAGPGFINFFLSSKYLAQMLNEIVRDDSVFGTSNNKSGQKTIVEFGDPNPFKEIHIGHLRNFCIGESFAKLLETQGYNVTRANYQGDVGLHVAKCLWGILQIENGELRIVNSETPKEEKVKLLAEGYVWGATEFENNENAKQEIIEINKRIYEEVAGSFSDAQDDSLKRLWEEGRKISLEHFEEIYKRIGVKYDKYFFESVTAKKGKEIVLSHIDDGVFERHDGAVVYRGEDEGLHTRVFLTSQDYATYEGKDLALALLKNEDEKYDRSVILTGNEQLEYFAVMLSALKKIAPEVAKKTSHYTFGHVRLKEGKMSSRTGDVITALWLMDEAVKRVREQFVDMDSDTAEKVGVGAVKYSMLKFSIPQDIHFSFEESINLEGNSGPYLQYSYVRTLSVLTKSSQYSVHNSQILHNDQLGSENLLKTENWKLETEEMDLVRFLSHFPYVLEQSAQDFAPNLLCNYLFELSKKFNLFYQKHKIIGSENEDFRLILTKAVGQVLKSGLNILGVETVERM